VKARHYDRSALARIEAQLATGDPDFDKRLRQASSLLPKRHNRKVAALSLAVLSGGGILLAVAVPDNVLSLAVVVGLPVAAAGVWAPILYRSARERRTAQPHERAHRFRSLIGPYPRLNQDELLIDPRDAVVVGCDGSPVSDAALRYAAAEARRRQLALLVVIAFAEPIDPDNDDFDTPPQVQRDRARAKAQIALERVVPDPPPHQVVAVAGLPGRVLAEKFSTAALIVIGARHKHLLGALTTAESTEHLVTTRGHAPVVVVPPTWPS
jgi:nucleotide-binding universal stress UspA family protein